ncbi:MAG: hypothetical protein CSA62_03960 [Planctomycetota bacterium]|nr:MAG: hypothetical protein CSA62_03960 [Planctomycetota bacterium]
MMKHLAIPGLAVLCLATPFNLTAQAQKPPKLVKKLSPVSQRYHELMTKVQKAQSQHYAEYRKKLAKARKEAKGKRPAVLPAFAPYDLKPHFAEFWKAAGSFEGEDQISFLLWIVRNGARSAPEQCKKAFALLLAEHHGSEKLRALSPMLASLSQALGAETTQAAINSLLKRSPHASVRAGALYSRAQIALAKAKQLSGTEKRAGIEKALSYFEKALATDDGESWASRARGSIHEFRKLQPGMLAPNIVGKDLDGVAFELSQYRGKVVLLSFWGDW